MISVHVMYVVLFCMWYHVNILKKALAERRWNANRSNVITNVYIQSWRKILNYDCTGRYVYSLKNLVIVIFSFTLTENSWRHVCIDVTLRKWTNIRRDVYRQYRKSDDLRRVLDTVILIYSQYRWNLWSVCKIGVTVIWYQYLTQVEMSKFSSDLR